jgi:major inositol transporter-like SP family MFS transporter
MLGVAVIPAIVFLVGLLTVPDSPRWYAAAGRFDEARRVLGTVRTPKEADEEFEAIKTHAAAVAKRDKGTVLQDLRAYPWMRRTLWIGIGLAIAQQATGINTAIYYAPTILKSTGLGNSASLVATVAVGIIGVLATILGIWLLGFVNRRRLLLIGFIGVAASQAALALSFLLPESGARSYIILAAMVLFVGFVQCFIGIGVWLLLAEIFPMKIRGAAMGIAVFVLWTTNTIISFVFPVLVEAVGSSSTFGLFFIINVLSIFFIAKYAPETKDRTLEEFEENLRLTGEIEIQRAH